MYALFAMEKYYGLKVQCHEGQINLAFDNSITGLMNIYLYEWEKCILRSPTVGFAEQNGRDALANGRDA